MMVSTAVAHPDLLYRPETYRNFGVGNVDDGKRTFERGDAQLPL
jgi:hypothetical protein